MLLCQKIFALLHTAKSCEYRSTTSFPDESVRVVKRFHEEILIKRNYFQRNLACCFRACSTKLSRNRGQIMIIHTYCRQSRPQRSSIDWRESQITTDVKLKRTLANIWAGFIRDKSFSYNFGLSLPKKGLCGKDARLLQNRQHIRKIREAMGISRRKQMGE